MADDLVITLAAVGAFFLGIFSSGAGAIYAEKCSHAGFRQPDPSADHTFD